MYSSLETTSHFGAGLPCGAFIAQCSHDEFTITDANDVFYALLGWPRSAYEALSSSQKYEIVSSYCRGRVRDSISYASQNNESVEISFEIARRNGSTAQICLIADINPPESEVFTLTGILIDRSRFFTSGADDTETDMFCINDGIDIGIAKVSSDARLVIYLNRCFCDITGYSKAELNNSFSSCMNRLLTGCEVDGIESLLGTEEVKKELPAVRRDGADIWLSVTVRPYSAGHIISITDITERKDAERRVAIQSERHSVLESISNEIIFEYDMQLDALTLPERCASQLGGSPVIEHFLDNIYTATSLSREDAAALVQLVSRIRAGNDVESAELQTDLFTGEEEWYRTVLTAIRDEKGEVIRIIGKLVNIDKAKREQQALALMTQRDPLTQLLNKAAANHAAESYIRGDGRDKTTAFMIVDVDNFKQVNDSLGHLFGDTVLQNVSASLRSKFRESDIVGRIGGDEFMVVMKDASEEIVKRKAREVCDALQNTYAGEKENISVSASVGIAIYPDDGVSFEELYHRADVALYATKRSGKNCFTFYREAVELNESGARPVKDVRSPSYVRRAEAYDLGIVSFAFDILSDTDDLDSAVNILLEKLGSTSHFTNISIHLTEKDYTHIRCAYEWTSSGGVSKCKDKPATGFSDWIEFFKAHDESGLLGIDDCTLSAYGRIIPQADAKSLVSCLMFEHGSFVGFITACDGQSIRHWSHSEKDTFAELSKIISYFVCRSAEEAPAGETAYTSVINGLCSVKDFRDIINRTILEHEDCSGFAVLCYDILNFKRINESCGYAAGDSVLQLFADFFGTLESSIAMTRTYADHFLAFIKTESRHMLAGTLMGMCSEFKDKVKRRLAQFGAESIEIDIVTGAYILTDDVKTADMVINGANLARQFAKENAEVNYAFYDDFLRKTVYRESQIIRSVNEALQRGEMEPYLQPKILAHTGRIVGAEALARWERDDADTLFPEDFVPVLERTGAIIELDFYIYERVLSIIREWLDIGVAPVPVSINLSRRHCTNVEFDKRLIDLAHHYDVPPQLIGFEFKESSYFDDAAVMSEKINLLREAGFNVSLDNIGAGSSCFRIVTDMNVDELKIDSSFVYNSIRNEKSRKIFRSMIAMCKSLGASIVCEGIEDRHVGDIVAGCGCDTIQGYLYARPMTASDFLDRLKGSGEK